MRSYIKSAACMTALLMLSACSQAQSEAPDVTASQSAAQTTEAEQPTAPQLTGADGMAVIDIHTKNQSPDAMDFVTKPVNSYVSHSVASWTPGYVVPPEPYYEECTVTVTDAENNVLIDSANAQVKVRGNWTTNYDKKPLRIKFEEKHSMLDLNGGSEMKNWILMAEYKDGSMLRNKTALSAAGELLSQDGLYAADSELVEVNINGRYWGVYLLTEHQQVNPSRINITEPPADYTGTDIGYFMEFDGYFKNEDRLQSFKVDYADNAPLVPYDGNGGSGRTMTCLPENGSDPKQEVGITIKSDIYSQEQHDFIASYVNNVYRIMYSAAYEDKAYIFNEEYTEISEAPDITPREAVEKAVDVDSLADMYIVSELTCDADIYWSSFFMDADFGSDGDKRLRFEAPWDFDSAMGNKSRCTEGTGFYAANIVYDVNNVYETINPWLAVLINEEWYMDIVREKWTAAYDNGVFERAGEQILADKDRYAAAFERNYQRWNNLADKSALGNELSYGASRCNTHGEAADHLYSWLSERVKFLNENWHI